MLLAQPWSSISQSARGLPRDLRGKRTFQGDHCLHPLPDRVLARMLRDNVDSHCRGSLSPHDHASGAGAAVHSPQAFQRCPPYRSGCSRVRRITSHNLQLAHGLSLGSRPIQQTVLLQHLLMALACLWQEVDMGRGYSFAETREVLDEIVTRSRGEIKHMNSPKVTSSGGTPATDVRGHSSPRLSEKAYSPRVGEPRPERSPRVGGRRAFSPRIGEIKPSKLGEGALNSPMK